MNTRMSLSAILLASVLLGAGCNPASPKATPTTDRPAAVQGFGQLPPIQQTSGQSAMFVAGNFTEATHSSISAVPPMAPVAVATDMAVSKDVMVTNVGGGMTSMMRMPAPQDVKVVYDVKASMPTWSADGTVYRVRPVAVNTSLARSISDAAGVPSQVSGGAREIQGANVSWRDEAGFIWNADMPGRNLNWWKYVDYSRPQDNSNPNPKLDAAAVKAAADNFLRDHGFAHLVGQGVLEENPMITPLLRGESLPCAMTAEGDARVAMPVPPPETSVVDSKLMIYPGPCGFPIQVTVYYPDSRDGMSTVDTGGWPSRKANIQIDIKDNSVVGGNVMLPTTEDSSSYPLISSDEAMKRLMAGGNNPVYGWHDGTGTPTEVRATISSVTLGWMRHDSWENNTSKVYFLPALLAEGTVDRGSNQSEAEKYHTVIPLVADAAFQTNPNPILYMKGGAEPAVDMVPAATTPAPAVMPKQ